MNRPIRIHSPLNTATGAVILGVMFGVVGGPVSGLVAAGAVVVGEVAWQFMRWVRRPR